MAGRCEFGGHRGCGGMMTFMSVHHLWRGWKIYVLNSF
ncbi:hypothetical protein LINPERHAP2_LOCUS23735 [Linum perenne]